jgi:mannitol/fructose-specific phosphotransferase system IIA component (Ntr-type)
MPELITEQLIALEVDLGSKRDVIEAIADLLAAGDRLEDRDGYVADVLAREDVFETGIGDEIAIPHARSAAASESSLVYLRLCAPVDWGESGPARFIFGIAVPAANADDSHLKILASVARKLLDPAIRAVVQRSASRREILDALRPRPEEDRP